MRRAGPWAWLVVVMGALGVAHPALLALLGQALGAKMQGSLVSSLILPGAAGINFVLAMRGARGVGLPRGGGRLLLTGVAVLLGLHTLGLSAVFAAAAWRMSAEAPPATGGLGVLVASLALSSATMGWMAGLQARDGNASTAA